MDESSEFKASVFIGFIFPKRPENKSRPGWGRFIYLFGLRVLRLALAKPMRLLSFRQTHYA